LAQEGGRSRRLDDARVDGALLPLLADWIGWQTDFSVSLAKQRNEVAYAPHYHRTTGVAEYVRPLELVLVLGVLAALIAAVQRGIDFCQSLLRVLLSQRVHL
jgi:hypothetical protein